MQAAFFKIANGQALHNMFIAALNERGLVGLNECILEAGQKELLEALKAVTVYLETHPTEAVVMHCVQGKDRTGLLAMLCQSMLDVSDDDIVADYYLSSVQLDDGGAAAAAATAAVAVAQGKLDRRFFSGAPAEVMEETLSVLRRRYGSVQPGYLDHIGFNEAWRSRFVAAVQQAEQPPTLNNRL
jgi:protein-tyrosine phosphatase